MTLKNEIEHLLPFRTLELVWAIFLCLVLMLTIYFLDHARILAFGLVPACSLYFYGRQRGISWKNTPKLFFTMLTIAICIYSTAVVLVLRHI